MPNEALHPTHLPPRTAASRRSGSSGGTERRRLRGMVRLPSPVAWIRSGAFDNHHNLEDFE